MNKRKILTLALTLSMVAILAIGGTLAYFTDTDSAQNVITVGELDIVLNENFENTDPNNGGKPMLPAVTNPEGETTDGFTWEEAHVTKEVTVTNESTANDAYVRVLFAAEDTRDIASAIWFNSPYHSGKTVREGENVWVTPKDGTNNWLQIKRNDGTVFTVHYVTLPAALAAGATSDKILKEVALEVTADNKWLEIADGEWELLVLVQGAQVTGDSATSSIDTAFGFTMDANADAKVAELFTKALGQEFSAFTAADYTAQTDLWVEGDGVNK